MDMKDSVRMTVGGLTIDPTTKAPIVLLRDEGNKLSLPIWIGLLEATSMATALEGIAMPRPMTHDLLKNLIVELGGTVEAVEIAELRENTYFAYIHLTVAGVAHRLDARPSDAISLALRIRCPIYVAKSVIESSSVLQQTEEEGGEPIFATGERDRWAEILERMAPTDFKYKM